MASDKVTVDINVPNAPKGANVTVPYLGTFKNGEPATVSRSQADRFVRNQAGASRYKGMDTIKIPPPSVESTTTTDDTAKASSGTKPEQDKSQEK